MPAKRCVTRILYSYTYADLILQANRPRSRRLHTKVVQKQLRFVPHSSLEPSHYEPAFNSAHAMVFPVRVLDDRIIPNLDHVSLDVVKTEDDDVSAVFRPVKGRVQTPFSHPQKADSWLGQ